MAGIWRVHLGNLWGGFRVGSNKAVLLVSPGDLKVSDAGTIDLSARYDPPGSGWRALVAALITLVVVVLLAQAMGSCAGPGWLLWYILFIFIRRHPVTLNLEQSESVVVDAVSRRLGFHTDLWARGVGSLLKSRKTLTLSCKAFARRYRRRLTRERLPGACEPQPFLWRCASFWLP